MFYFCFVLYRSQAEQNMKTFSNDFIVDGGVNQQNILAEDAKALADFRIV